MRQAQSSLFRDLALTNSTTPGHRESGCLQSTRRIICIFVDCRNRLIFHRLPLPSKPPCSKVIRRAKRNTYRRRSSVSLYSAPGPTVSPAELRQIAPPPSLRTMPTESCDPPKPSCDIHTLTAIRIETRHGTSLHGFGGQVICIDTPTVTSAFPSLLFHSAGLSSDEAACNLLKVLARIPVRRLRGRRGKRTTPPRTAGKFLIEESTPSSCVDE